MDVRRRLVQHVHQQLDETVGHYFFVVVIAQLERVVEEDVRFVFVVIRIDNLSVEQNKNEQCEFNCRIERIETR